MDKITTAQLANYLSVSKRTIQRKTISGGWPYEEVKGVGGVRRLYPFSTLPADVKQKIVASIISSHEIQGLDYIPENPIKKVHVASAFNLADTPFIAYEKAKQGDWLSKHAFAHKVDVGEMDKTYVKIGLLVMAKLYTLHHSLGKIKGMDQFCEKYNGRKLKIDKKIYTMVHNVSRISLLRWEKKEQDLGQIYKNIGESENEEIILDRDLRVMAEEVLMISPDISAKRLRHHFVTIFVDRKLPSERQFSLWLQQAQQPSFSGC